MLNHILYLKYVVKHKYYVLTEGWKLGVPLWQLIIHDWTKFTRAEWIPYVQKFYTQIRCQESFAHAINHHYHANPHHWQYWLLTTESSVRPLEMPDRYLLEMLAGWISVGKVLDGKDWVASRTKAWWDEHKDNMVLGGFTRAKIEYFFENGTIKIPASVFQDNY